MPNPHDVISKLSFVIKHLVEAPEVLIAPPTSVEDLEEHLLAPWNFLLSSISAESLQKLIDGGLWSTPTISFFVFPYDMPLPNYIMTIQNLTVNDDDEGTKFVARTIKEKLKSITAPRMTRRPQPTFWTRSTPRPSRSPSPGAGQTNIVFNIYCVLPPSLSLSDFLKWMNSAHTIHYDTMSHRSGVARTGHDQLFCIGCKGYDHPTRLCPILRIIGIFLIIHKLAGDDNVTLQKWMNVLPRRPRFGKPKNDRSGNKSGGQYMLSCSTFMLNILSVKI
ncbi:hypothetical protein B0H13DRAFT_1874394 [Mycena leptocephala]|nr:hypothetical protein B0H13DRAFT_1874394 [Mycena leptocephala]